MGKVRDWSEILYCFENAEFFSAVMTPKDEENGKEGEKNASLEARASVWEKGEGREMDFSQEESILAKEAFEEMVKMREEYEKEYFGEEEAYEKSFLNTEEAYEKAVGGKEDVYENEILEKIIAQNDGNETASIRMAEEKFGKPEEELFYDEAAAYDKKDFAEYIEREEDEGRSVLRRKKREKILGFARDRDKGEGKSVKIEVTNNNTIEKESDIDEIVYQLTDKLCEMMTRGADGLY